MTSERDDGPTMAERVFHDGSVDERDEILRSYRRTAILHVYQRRGRFPGLRIAIEGRRGQVFAVVDIRGHELDALESVLWARRRRVTPMVVLGDEDEDRARGGRR